MKLVEITTLHVYKEKYPFLMWNSYVLISFFFFKSDTTQEMPIANVRGVPKKLLTEF